MIKNLTKRQVVFHIAELSNGFCFVLFLKKRLLHFLFHLFMQEKVQVKISEAAVCRRSSKQLFLKISQCPQKAPAFESFYNKPEALKACIFIKKEILTQVFSCEYCEVFKNSFLVEDFLFIILLRDDRILWTSLCTKLTSFIFLVLLLCFPSYRESTVISYLFLYQNCQ